MEYKVKIKDLIENSNGKLIQGNVNFICKNFCILLSIPSASPTNTS